MLVARFPDWPVAAAGFPPEVPAVAVFANRVIAATRAARRSGVDPGLRRREAQGRCPELVVAPADPGRDTRAWEPAVLALESLTPWVEVLAPGGVALATRGPSRYFGGDSALAALVAATVDRAVGQDGCRVGVADGRFAAALAARAAAGAAAGDGPAVVVPPGRSREWLAPQPVGTLGADYEELAGLLVRLGVRTFADLAALPAPSVLGRFGHLGAAAHRLARGLDERPVAARTPPPDLAVTAELDPPAEQVETAAFAAKALADALHQRLGESGLAPAVVAIEAETEHGERLVRRWRHEGLLTPAGLSDRVRWQLDGWLAGRPGPGGVAGDARGIGDGRPTAGLTLLRLTPEEVRPAQGLPLRLWGGVSDGDTRAGRALARVQGMLGPEKVVTAALGGGRGLAEQVRLIPWGDARPDPTPTPVPASGHPGRRGEQPPWPGRLNGPSPALVHRDPPPAEVRDDRGTPVAVTARGLLSAPPAAVSIGGGPLTEVEAWAGPWPLEERWWDGNGGRRRARLQVLLAGGDAHLITREGGRWRVEATYG